MEWLIILVLWIVSLFLSYKMGKKVEEKTNETNESNARSDAVSRGSVAANNAVNSYRMQNK